VDISYIGQTRTIVNTTPIRDLSLIQKFNMISLLILLTCLVILGRWVSRQIESRVLERVGHTTSLFAGSVIAPAVLDMLSSDGTEGVGAIDAILDSTGLGQEIRSLKVWDSEGRVIHSSNPSEIGKLFEIEGGLLSAWNGIVSAEISELDRAEHSVQRQLSNVLLETYSPIREPGTGRIVAVVEFYQTVDAFRGELRNARMQSWVITTAVVLLIYLSLVVLVRSGSRTIVRQRDTLQHQLEEYEALLQSNKELHERLRSSAARATALNEQFLRRIAAELHDGPGQEIGYALLTLERLTAAATDGGAQTSISGGLKGALDRSLADIRSISSGLRSPDLERLSVDEVVRRAIRIHGSRVPSQVDLHIGAMPENATLASKITLFRVLQESLSNAFRHAGDAAPVVKVKKVQKTIHLEVIDHGLGLTVQEYEGIGSHLGLEVMRERVELLGGQIEIHGAEPTGTIVIARIPYLE
jgi:signal transduction histidine kinase